MSNPIQNELVWERDWNGFRLSVLKIEDGFVPFVLAPFEENDAKTSKTPFDTQPKAERRCWGMVSQLCDIISEQAKMRMFGTMENPVPSEGNI
jgi:hypothetical protein